MRIIVFLGPTLPLPEARALLDAEYLPPVRAGDVFALVAEKPAAIAIIDGLFAQVPSVGHKEVLHALANGVRVFGASSMGALRAAELAAFGMEGVGAVFEAYRDGVYEDDDEVAVVHGPAEYGYRAMSEAMANLRAGLAAELARGAIRKTTHDELVARSKARFYPDRSWGALLADAKSIATTDEERAALAEMVRSRPSAKTDDARLLLRHVAAERAAGMSPHAPSFRMETSPAQLETFMKKRQPAPR